MIRVAIVGFGNVGKYVLEAVNAADDMELACVISSPRTTTAPAGLEGKWSNKEEDIKNFGSVDVAILCLPSRACPEAAKRFLSMGINTVDSFDIHDKIWDVKCDVQKTAEKNGKVSVISAGWDPGSDSVVRALLEAVAPKGITYTNFGPGMSMGHTVAVKAIEGVKAALSMTIPLGTGIHRRMVYIELMDGYTLEETSAKIKADPYFVHDETHVFAVGNVDKLLDMGHGVNLVRKGVSGTTQNQMFEFNMRIDNPALTAQIMVACARATTKRPAGCYTMIEIPMIDMLAGDTEDLIKRLV